MASGNQVHSPTDITLHQPDANSKRKQMKWQDAVRYIIDQRGQVQASDLQTGSTHKIIVTDAYIEDINRHIRSKLAHNSNSNGIYKRRASGPRVHPARDRLANGTQKKPTDTSVSDVDFFVSWGSTVRGVFLPALHHTFKSQDLEKLYQQFSSDQRRTSLAVTNFIDIITKLHIIVIYLAVAPEMIDSVRGGLAGLFMALDSVLCVLVIVSKGSLSPEHLRYAGLAIWLSQTVQVLAGLVYGLEKDQSWYVLFILFSTYTLLPLPLLWSICTACLTSTLHLLVESIQNFNDVTIIRKVRRTDSRACYHVTMGSQG